MIPSDVSEIFFIMLVSTLSILDARSNACAPVRPASMSSVGFNPPCVEKCRPSLSAVIRRRKGCGRPTPVDFTCCTSRFGPPSCAPCWLSFLQKNGGKPQIPPQKLRHRIAVTARSRPGRRLRARARCDRGLVSWRWAVCRESASATRGNACKPAAPRRDLRAPGGRASSPDTDPR